MVKQRVNILTLTLLLLLQTLKVDTPSNLPANVCTTPT
jgi:hypothetical protein